ncbi:MAG: hypothetical protein L3J97_03210 [Thermoplasmata archaeon]|nr:hypothetical protein [Thermoplasmata archaeon]
MRSGFIVAGVIILAIGVGFWYFPLQSVSTGATVLSAGSEETVGGGAPYSVLGHQAPYSLKWSSVSSVTVNVYDCGTDSTCALPSAGPLVGQSTGSSGAISWSGPYSHYFAIIPTGGSATVAVTYVEPLEAGYAGIGGVVLGVALLLLGILIKTPPTVREERIEEPFGLRTKETIKESTENP